MMLESEYMSFVKGVPGGLRSGEAQSQEVLYDAPGVVTISLTANGFVRFGIHERLRRDTDFFVVYKNARGENENKLSFGPGDVFKMTIGPGDLLQFFSSPSNIRWKAHSFWIKRVEEAYSWGEGRLL